MTSDLPTQYPRDKQDSGDNGPSGAQQSNEAAVVQGLCPKCGHYHPYKGCPICVCNGEATPPAVLDSEWGGENGPSAGTDALEERWERLCEHCGTWNNGDMRPEDIFAFFDAEKKEAVAAVERQHADQMAHASESFLEQLTAQKERIRAEARLEGHDEACRDCGIENGVLAECPLRTSLRLNVERATSKPVCKTCGGQGRVEAPNAQFHDPCPDCAAPEPRQEKERK